MTGGYVPRIFAYFAATAPRAVLLVRLGRVANEGRQYYGGWRYRATTGAALWEMVTWNLASGVFVRGQWVRLLICPTDCHLSPDGELFCYRGGHYSSHNCWGWDRYKNKHVLSPVYAVACRPPYFSAVALWEPDPEAYDGAQHNGEFDMRWSAGGGYWATPRHLQLGFYRARPSRGTPPPAGTRVDSTDRDTVERATRGAEAAHTLLHTAPAAPVDASTQAARALGVPASADGAWRHSGRVFYSEGGRLYAAGGDAESKERTLLFDCARDEFVQLRPPSWALNWPTEPGGQRPA